MNYRKIISNAVHAQKDNNLTAFAVIAGLAAGAALALLFTPRSGSDYRKMLAERFSGVAEKTSQELQDHLIDDLRETHRAHADQLQGPAKKRKNPTQIKVPSAGTDAWKKKNQEEA